MDPSNSAVCPECNISGYAYFDSALNQWICEKCGNVLSETSLVSNWSAGGRDVHSVSPSLLDYSHGTSRSAVKVAKHTPVRDRAGSSSYLRSVSGKLESRAVASIRSLCRRLHLNDSTQQKVVDSALQLIPHIKYERLPAALLTAIVCYECRQMNIPVELKRAREAHAQCGFGKLVHLKKYLDLVATTAGSRMRRCDAHALVSKLISDYVEQLPQLAPDEETAAQVRSRRSQITEKALKLLQLSVEFGPFSDDSNRRSYCLAIVGWTLSGLRLLLYRSVSAMLSAWHHPAATAVHSLRLWAMQTVFRMQMVWGVGEQHMQWFISHLDDVERFLMEIGKSNSEVGRSGDHIEDVEDGDWNAYVSNPIGFIEGLNEEAFQKLPEDAKYRLVTSAVLQRYVLTAEKTLSTPESIDDTSTDNDASHRIVEYAISLLKDGKTPVSVLNVLRASLLPSIDMSGVDDSDIIDDMDLSSYIRTPEEIRSLRMYLNSAASVD